MLAKAITVFAIIAAVNSGAPVSYLAADPHVGAQAEHTVRGFGGLSSVSQYSKAVDSPFSTVRKTDTRVTNDAVAYAAPAYAHQGYAAPIAHGYSSPIAQHGYATAPIAHHGYATAPIAHHGYAATPIAHHGYAAAPIAHGYAASAGLAHHKVVGASPLGVAYSAVSPAVATLNFNGYGVSYGY